MADDFAHRLLIDHIRSGDRIELSAGEEERLAVAERLGLSSLERLEAHAALERTGSEVRARGRVKAVLSQSCVATGEPVPEHLDEAFELLFLPEPSAAAAEEIELAEAECDTVFYEGGAIDLGTAVADTLALSINPYPRSAGADAALKQAGVLSEAEAGPFAALAKLKRGSDSEA